MSFIEIIWKDVLSLLRLAELINRLDTLKIIEGFLAAVALVLRFASSAAKSRNHHRVFAFAMWAARFWRFLKKGAFIGCP